MYIQKLISILLLCLCLISSCSKPETAKLAPNDIEQIESSVQTGQLSADKINAKEDEVKIPLPPDKNNNSQLIGFNEATIVYKIDSTNQDTSELIDSHYYVYDRNKKKSIPMYSPKNCSIIIFEELYQNDLIIGEGYVTDTMTFKIKRIRQGQEYVLFEKECNSLPIITIINDMLLINYQFSNQDTNFQPLEYIDLVHNTHETIKTPEYKSINASNITGTVLQSVDGFRDGFILESIIFNNEDMMLDDTGVTKLSYYDLDKHKEYPLPINSSTKYTYVSGDYRHIITNKYANERPLDDCGELYLLKGHSYHRYSIPGIRSSNDITKCYLLSNGYLLLNTMQSSYIIDCDHERCNDLGITTTLKIHENTIAYMEQDTVHLFDYS